MFCNFWWWKSGKRHPENIGLDQVWPPPVGDCAFVLILTWVPGWVARYLVVIRDTGGTGKVCAL